MRQGSAVLAAGWTGIACALLPISKARETVNGFTGFMAQRHCYFSVPLHTHPLTLGISTPYWVIYRLCSIRRFSIFFQRCVPPDYPTAAGASARPAPDGTGRYHSAPAGSSTPWTSAFSRTWTVRSPSNSGWPRCKPFIALEAHHLLYLAYFPGHHRCAGHHPAGQGAVQPDLARKPQPAGRLQDDNIGLYP